MHSRWLPLALSSLALVSACALDRGGLLSQEAGGSAGSPTTGPGGMGGGGGQGGALPECAGPEDCPVSSEDCRPRACVQGMCTQLDAMPGTPCDDDGGEVCDDSGSCLVALGSACTTGISCVSGICVDGVCCESVCDGLCATCDDGVSPGFCNPHAPATDPESECMGGVCDGAEACANGTSLKSQQWGDGEEQGGEAIAVDSTDDVIVAGAFYGTLTLGANVFTTSSRDLFLVHLDATAGTVGWARQLDTNDWASLGGIAVDGSDNLFVCGYWWTDLDVGGGSQTSVGGSDVFVAKYDASGNLLWDKRMGGAGAQRCYDLAVDSGGNVVLAVGHHNAADYGGGTITSAGDRDLVVAKYDAAGNHLWSKGFGDALYQDADAIAVDGQDNIILFGNYQGQIDFGGGALVNAGSDEDLYLAKLDSSGNHLHSARYGSSDGIDYAIDVVVDSADQIILAGSHESTIDFGNGPVASMGTDDAFVVKLDATLSHVWSRHFGDGAGQATFAVAVDGNDNVIATGDHFGQVNLGGQLLTSAGGRDIFLGKYAASGEHLWSASYGDSSGDRARGVAVQSNGRILLTGSFAGSIDFGSGVMTSAGSDDVFLAGFAP